MKTYSRSRQQGFTLMEIMMVVLIIGLLIGMVGQGIFGKDDKARVVVTKGSLQQIQSALVEYKMDNFRFPDTDQGIQALISAPDNAPKWKGPYMSKLPKDGWDNEFQYFYPGEGNRPYDLYSWGADSTEGGQNYDADISVWD